MITARSPRSGELLHVLGEHVNVGVDMLECLLEATNTLHQLLELWLRDEVVVAGIGLLRHLLLLLSSSIAGAEGLPGNPWSLLPPQRHHAY